MLAADLLHFVILTPIALTIGAVIGLAVAWQASLFAQAERDLVNPDLTLDGEPSWD